MKILIQIKNKVAIPQNSPVIICDNSDYQAVFLFDAPWAEHPLKTARFRFVRNGTDQYIDVPFSGDTVDIPALRDVDRVQIGVYAEELQTTTPAEIPCAPSIRSGESTPEEPEESVYDEILRLIREGAVRGEKGEKGDAYILTDADKAEIADLVLAELPETEPIPVYDGAVEVI